ncbi:hypothetical protein ACVGXT_08885 [Enterobacter intestinihominis]
MSTSTIEALGTRCATIADESELPADYQGTGTQQAHRAMYIIKI